MVFNAIFFSIFLPLSIQGPNFAPVDLNKPFLVKAAIDSSRIIGLPSSKAAKANALKVQSLDPSLKQITVSPDPVSERKLFFRNYFK
jgi:hypothetical protein